MDDDVLTRLKCTLPLDTRQESVYLITTVCIASTSSRVFEQLNRIFGVAFAVGGELPALKQMLNAVQEGIAIVVR